MHAFLYDSAAWVCFAKPKIYLKPLKYDASLLSGGAYGVHIIIRGVLVYLIHWIVYLDSIRDTWGAVTTWKKEFLVTWLPCMQRHFHQKIWYLCFCICCLFGHILTVHHCELSWQPLNRKCYCTLWYYSVKALCVSSLAFKGNVFSCSWTVPVVLPDETESDMMISHWRVAPRGVNWSWMVRGAIKSPSSTVLVFIRNWTWIAACVRKCNENQQLLLSYSVCELIMQQNTSVCAVTAVSLKYKEIQNEILQIYGMSII